MNLPADSPLLECIPNFSEGRDAAVIQELASAVESTPGVALLDVDRSPAANRVVLTFAGAPDAVVEAAFQAMQVAAERIDMRRQTGVHPRIGATDVCPLVPLANLSAEEAVLLASQLASRAGRELGIPIYLYEESQPQPHRKALPHIRKGWYEGFAAKMQTEGWAPDHGPAAFNERTGATVVGVRNPLVAFNISLDSADERLAGHIARQLRSQGIGIPDHRLPATRAIGWYMADYGNAQVSFNLLNYQQTSPLRAYLACEALAAAAGVGILGSELIGLMPESCLAEAGSYLLGSKEMDINREAVLEAGVLQLGLDRLRPFSIRHKILEHSLAAAGFLRWPA